MIESQRVTWTAFAILAMFCIIFGWSIEVMILQQIVMISCRSNLAGSHAFRGLQYLIGHQTSAVVHHLSTNVMRVAMLPDYSTIWPPPILHPRLAKMQCNLSYDISITRANVEI